MSLESSSGSKRTRFKDEVFLFPENVEVISLDNEDEVKIGESGLNSENPITICSDEEEDDVIFGKDENLFFLYIFDEDDESEEDETSDEDFEVDELNEASDEDDDSYEVEEKKINRMITRKYFDVVEELERERGDDG
ncbi:hypothetical protein QL285_085778 [Trifolium repens]|nr:hypothetical protein QL285_085778 [Trifolium repens]